MDNIIHGDCLVVMAGLGPNSVDAIVTDPPYGLAFMGKGWDHGIPGIPFWAEALRVARPGCYLLAFGGTRTFHRLACAIEDAGWEIRDTLMWVYGSGFPKSHDVSKAIDKAAGKEREVVGPGQYHCEGRTKAMGTNGIYGGPPKDMVGDGKWETAPATDAARQWEGWGTALKPAYEPIILARKPLEGTVAENVQKWGTGAINVDGCRVETKPRLTGTKNPLASSGSGNCYLGSDGKKQIAYDANPPSGRWPANLIHDGSEEVLVNLMDKSCGHGHFPKHPKSTSRGIYGKFLPMTAPERNMSDNGDKSAARFFKTCAYSELELLFHRAKAIIEAWNPDLVNIVERDLSLSNQVAVSALRDVVTAASLGDKLLNDVKGLSTTVPQTELNLLCETLIMAILSFGNGYSPGLWQDGPSPNGCLVRFAETPGQTGTMTITISHWKLNGTAEDATFSIMPQSMALGEKGSKNGSRFTYCAKASRAEREIGCEGMEERISAKNGSGLGRACSLESRKEISGDDLIRAKNHHPTVKPLALMRYLCRLATPPNGVILDPFMGSGTTGMAAKMEGFGFIGIEKEKEYVEIAERRIGAIQAPLL